MLGRHLTAAAGLLALAAMPPVLAQVSGQASLTGLTYALYDLDLTDSHTPSIVFSVPENSPIGPGRNAAEGQYAPYEGPDPGRAELLLGTRSGASTMTSIVREHASASVETRMIPDGEKAPDLAILMDWNIVGSGREGAGISLFGEQDAVYFTLAPRTRVTFSTTLALEASVGAAGSHEEQLDVSAWLSVYNLYDQVNDALITGTSMSANNRPGGSQAVNDRYLLQASFDNPGELPLYASTSMFMNGYAYSIAVSAVPEPAAGSLLLAGALLLAGRRARERVARRKNAAQSLD